MQSQNFIQHENARLTAENKALQNEIRNLRDFVTVLEDFYSAGERFRDDSELLPFLGKVLVQALNLVNAPDGSLLLLDDETNELVFVIVHGELSENLSGYRISAEDGIAGWVVKNRRPTLVRDVRRDIRFSAKVDDAFKFRTQSIAAVPLIGNQKVYGIIEALNQPGDDPFSEEDLALLKLVCRAAGEALADIDARKPA